MTGSSMLQQRVPTFGIAVLRWLLWLVLWGHAAASGFSGQVVGVVDGDTVDVLHQQQTIRIRLAGIDAPERRQAFGQRARQALADMTFHREVEVIPSGTDRHGRVLAVLTIKGVSVNVQLVRAGMAWVYRAYTTDPQLFAAEREAQESRRGLWADPNPVPPWDFRRQPRDSQ